MTEAANPSRRGTLMVFLCTAAAFGPYIASGIRTEQVAVYAAFGLLLVSPAWLRIRPSQAGFVVAALWAVLLAVAAIGAMAPAPNGTRYPYGSTFAGIDNLALPLAVMLLVWWLIGSGADRDVLLRTACRVAVWAMCINAGLAVLGFAGKELDLSLFYNGDGGESVSYKASTVGRFSGAINQPAEAGVLYSVALLAALFLYQQRATLMAITATVLTVGGVLTVSKIFLLVGAPIALWQISTAAGGRRRRYTALGGVVLLAAGVMRSGLLPAWAGQDFLLRLLPGNGQDAVTLYTAGRLGETSTLSVVAEAVLRTSPVFGFGAAGLKVPYDNAWVEALVVSGLVGAVTYTAVLVALASAWWTRRQQLTRASSRLAGGIVAVVAGASGGVPALTANRCATVVWILLTLLLLTVPTQEEGRLGGLENLVGDGAGVRVRG